MDHGNHDASNKEDALRDGDLWAESVIEASKRLDPPDEVKFLTEVIGVLTVRRDETAKFIHGDNSEQS
jgi:hypothetical protein